MRKRARLDTKASGTCTRCRKTPAVEGRATCEPCRRADVVRATAYGKKIGMRELNLRRNYGIGSAEVTALLASQGGVCAICSGSEPGGRHGQWDVDHDHSTGKIRGVLCDACNRGLGFFRDDPARLSRAIGYLSGSRGPLSVEIKERAA